MSKYAPVLAFCFLSFFASQVVSEPDGASAATASSSKVDPVPQPQGYNLPPDPGPAGPVGPGPAGPGFFGFPGLGAGFSKGLNINGYAGYGLPGFFGGGFGGPAVPVDGGEPVPPIGGPGLGGGFLGPSYLPQTWLGSALGAKGDILFPIVIFIFFVVGVWAVINFLLALVVPIIAAKIAVVDGGIKKVRSADDADADEQAKLAYDVNQAIDKQY